MLFIVLCSIGISKNGICFYPLSNSHNECADYTISIQSKTYYCVEISLRNKVLFRMLSLLETERNIWENTIKNLLGARDIKENYKFIVS